MRAMRSVLMTIKKEYLDLILSGKKKWELRKSYPKTEGVPIRVYLCESGSHGQIKAEFTCNWISVIEEPNCNHATQACLEVNEIRKYLNGHYGYLWNISKLIDYSKCDPPCIKMIADFGVQRPPQSWMYVY